MYNYSIDPGRSNHKYENYLKKELEMPLCTCRDVVYDNYFKRSLQMSCNHYVTSKPNIVIMYTDDGVKNRLDFPIVEVEYNGKTYTAYFNSFKVKMYMTMVLDLLLDSDTNYEMYLLCSDFNKKPNYIPVNIVKKEANYIVLQEYNNHILGTVSNIFEEMTKNISIWYGDMTFTMPKINQIWYNNPYTTIKWSDGRVTTSKCSSTETFSKEVGVAMCISKKYLECRGAEYPRTGFKSLVDSGVDLKEIHDKRDRKKALKRATDMAKAGYSMEEIQKTLNLTDDDVFDLFMDESDKE